MLLAAGVLAIQKETPRPLSVSAQSWSRIELGTQIADSARLAS